MVFFAPMVIGTSLHMCNFLHMHLFPNVKFLSHVINVSQSVKIMHMHINLHKMLKKRLIFSFWFFKCHVLIIACFFFMWNNFTILDAWRNLYNPITKKLLEIVRIMHSCRSKVDNSGMPIGSCRPRLGRSIGLQCHTARHEVSTHALTTKHQEIATSLRWSKNPFTPKN
jgi:hypothetical protein